MYESSTKRVKYRRGPYKKRGIRGVGIYDEQSYGSGYAEAVCGGKELYMARRARCGGNDAPSGILGVNGEEAYGMVEETCLVAVTLAFGVKAWVPSAGLRLLHERGYAFEGPMVWVCECNCFNNYRAFGALSVDGVNEPLQGKRSDLMQCAEKLLGGKKVQEIMRDHPSTMIRYYRGLKQLEMSVSKESVPQWRKVTVQVLWGPTGTGKTRKALELAGNDYYMLCKVCLFLFDCYLLSLVEQQAVVVGWLCVSECIGDG